MLFRLKRTSKILQSLFPLGTFMRKENCLFSGLPVHPGHGKRFVPTLVVSTRPILTFTSSKARKLYLRKKNPRVIPWTTTYRKMNRKSVTVEEIRKRNRRAKKVQRPIAGADLEQIKQRGAKRDTLRLKAKDAALKELEERKAKRTEATQKKEVKKPIVKIAKPAAPRVTKPVTGPKKGGR